MGDFTAYKRAFEISPITLVGGSAGDVFGGLIPLLSMLQGIVEAITGEEIEDLDDAFANFAPIPGGTIVSNQIATYPLANKATASNAYIAQPLAIAMRMTCPAGNGGVTMSRKAAILSALKRTLAQHCANGGLFHVATPSIFYDYCMLVDCTDATAEGLQSQAMFRFDFAKPLITLADAQDAQNTLMNQLDSGATTDGETSGPGLADAPNAQGAPTTTDGAVTSGAGIGGTPSIDAGPGGGSGFGITGGGGIGG